MAQVHACVWWVNMCMCELVARALVVALKIAIWRESVQRN